MMDKLLKYGIVFMFFALVLLPTGVFIKNSHSQLGISVMLFAMCLELIGLIFVIVGIIKKRRNTKA